MSRHEDSCTLSVGPQDSAKDCSGTAAKQKTSFILRRAADEGTLELVPLNLEIDFRNSASATQISVYQSNSQSSNEPNPNNPYDYRHYLNDTDTNGSFSPRPSNVPTPQFMGTPRASSPMVMLSETDDLPSMAVSHSDRKKASQKEAQASKKAQRRRVQRPAIHAAPKHLGSSPDDDARSMYTLDSTEHQSKRQRIAKEPPSAPGERLSKQSKDVLVDVQDASSGYEDDDESDGANDEELPESNATQLHAPQPRHEILDAAALSRSLQAAFEAGDDDDEVEEKTAEANVAHNAESESESESEEE